MGTGCLSCAGCVFHRPAPPARTSLEKLVRLCRTPASGGVIREFGRRLLRPRFENRRDEAPLLFNLLGAHEQELISLDRVEHQVLIRLGQSAKGAQEVEVQSSRVYGHAQTWLSCKK